MTSQTIVITGASDGIGAAAARRLQADGNTVVLVGRSAAKTAAVADELGAPYHLADFSDLDQVRALADTLLTHPGLEIFELDHDADLALDLINPTPADWP